MRKLKRDELIAVRDTVLSLIPISQERRGHLVETDQMQPDESDKIAEYEQSLNEIARDLNDAILRVIVTDLNEPKDRIVAITKDVKEAIKSLESLNDFLGILASVLTMVTTIITAFTTGNVLQLVNVLDQIEDLI